MAHELSIRENGFVEMAYSGELPWHAKGQHIAADAPIEEWITGAGMDWRIQRSKVRYATSADTTAETLIDEDHLMLFRSDSKAPLAIVSPQFQIFQPKDTLEFFRSLIEDNGFTLTTAGVLKGGRKFWAQGERTDFSDNVLGNDVIKGKLLVASSCDGSMQTIVKQVSERVVCANTLSIATKEGGKQIKVSHRSKFCADSAKQQMGISVHDFEDFIGKARSLACTEIAKGEAEAFIMPLLFKPTEFDTPKGLQDCRESKGFVQIMALFNGRGKGANLAGTKGTAWGIVNAVTEFVDHHRGNAGTSGDARMDYALFGPGDKLKTLAFDTAVAAFA